MKYFTFATVLLIIMVGLYSNSDKSPIQTRLESLDQDVSQDFQAEVEKNNFVDRFDVNNNLLEDATHYYFYNEDNQQVKLIDKKTNLYMLLAYEKGKLAQIKNYNGTIVDFIIDEK